MKKFKKGTLSSWFNYLLVIAAFIICQSMINAGAMSRSMKGQLVPICVYVVMAVSLNLVVGISGELSLGHAGFMSIGAFTGTVCSGWMLQSMNVENPTVRLIVALIVAGVLAGVFGFLIGIPVLRLRGDYLAIVTLAFGEIIRNLVNCIYINVGENGKLLFGFSDPNLPGKAILAGPKGTVSVQRISTFTMGIVLVLFTLLVVQNLVRSRCGRAIMATRDSRIAAESVGINVTKYKMIAFVTGAVLAGMAGALFGLNFSSVNASKFKFDTSILVLVFVVLGGIGNITGSIIAATLLTVLPELLRAFSDYRMLVYAVVLILVMLMSNSPILRGLIETIKEKITRLVRSKAKGGKAA